MELIDRDKIEARFANRIERLNARHRNRLRSLLGNPPDLNKVPPEFWRSVERETEELLLAFLLLIFVTSSRQHGMSPSIADDRGRVMAQTEAPRLARRSAENSQRAVTRSVLGGANARDTASAVFSPTRAATLARTVTTTARTAGILDAADDQSTTVIGDDGSRIPPDQTAVLVWELEVTRQVESHCSFCPLMNGRPREYWARFYPRGPACHVVCACGIVVLPPGAFTKPVVAHDSSVIQAAKESGVFGF